MCLFEQVLLRWSKATARLIQTDCQVSPLMSQMLVFISNVSFLGPQNWLGGYRYSASDETIDLYSA